MKRHRRSCLQAARVAASFCVFSSAAFALPAGTTTEVVSPSLRATPAPEAKKEVVRPYLFASLGMGFPELANAQLGVFVHPRVTLDAVYGWVLFNHMVGGGLTGYFFGTPREHATPGHTLTLSGYIRNNIAEPFGATSAGETIGATAELGIGYAYHAAFGLRVSGQVLGFVTPERHTITGGPVLRLSAGWVFPFGVE